MSARSVSSRSSSNSSVSSRSSHSSGKSSTRSYKERRLPDTPAVNTLLYFTGRQPRKVKGVRVYQTTWDDGYDDRSEHSGWSNSSWGSNKIKTEIYLLETRGPYWDGAYSEKSSHSGRSSRASRKGGNHDPWGKGSHGRRAQVDDDDGSDDDGSVHGFPHPGGPHPGPPMMGRPPMHQFPPPPPGAFQPGFGPPPQGFPGPQPGHPGHPGFPPQRTPGPMPGPPPPPQPQQQGFRTDPNGINVFMG